MRKFLTGFAAGAVAFFVLAAIFTTTMQPTSRLRPQTEPSVRLFVKKHQIGRGSIPDGPADREETVPRASMTTGRPKPLAPTVQRPVSNTEARASPEPSGEVQPVKESRLMEVKALSMPPLPQLEVMGIDSTVSRAAGDYSPGGSKVCTEAIKKAGKTRSTSETEEGAGMLPFAGEPMASSDAVGASDALKEAGKGWGALFDRSIKAFSEKARQDEANRISELPASSCTLFEGSSGNAAVEAAKGVIDTAVDTSRQVLTGLALQAAELCEGASDSKVMVFIPPGRESELARQAVSIAIDKAGCSAVNAFGSEYGPDHRVAGEDAMWKAVGPAPTEEVLASIAAAKDSKPSALLLYGAFRRSINPFRVAAILRLAAQPRARLVVAERLFDTIDNTDDTVDSWRMPPDGLGFLLQMGLGTWGTCGYVSSRSAAVAMANKAQFTPVAATGGNKLEWGGLKDATKRGRPTFGAFVIGTWYVVTLPDEPLALPGPEEQHAGEWSPAELDERVGSAIGAAGQGIRAARSRCVSLKPRKAAPWLAQFARGVGSSARLPNGVTSSPQSLLTEVWFTRFGWYFNLLSLLQSLPKCGKILMVSSHESLVPKMLRSASCAGLGCIPEMHNVDWPKMDIQRLDDALDRGYIQAGEEGYDMVVLDQVLEHVPHILRATASVRRLLKPGGSALIAMPATNPVHHGPLDMWRAQLDAMLVVGAALGRIEGCGTAVSNGLQAELASQYPAIYRYPLKEPALLDKAAEAGDFVGSPPKGSMASTSWVLVTKPEA